MTVSTMLWTYNRVSHDEKLLLWVDGSLITLCREDNTTEIPAGELNSKDWLHC